MFDLTLYNGKIYSITEENECFNYIVIKDGIIKEIGNSNLKEVIENSKRVIDLDGKTILPSFSDGHVHLVQTGLNYLGLDLSGVTTIDEVLSLISERSKNVSPGKLIRGIHFDVTRIKERRFPTKRELDDVSNNNPVWINSIEFHMSAVNSMALHLVNLPYFIDGIARDERNLPEGFLSGKASAYFRNRVFEKITDRERMLGVNIAIESIISKGVTSVHAMEGGYSFHDKDVQFILKNKNKFPIDIHLFYQSYDIEKIVENNLKRIGGDIFIDGSFGSKTAAISENYIDSEMNGKLYFNDDELDYFIKSSLKNKLQISLHTIGDRAIDQALKSFEKYLISDEDKALRHRLEHFELASDKHIEIAKKLNIDISVQPVYENLWGGMNQMYEKRLGKRYLETNRFRKYIDNGLNLIGGSDSDVTEINPILGIHSAVNHPKENSRISVLEAIRMFTYNCQYSVFKENEKGTLEKDKTADFIILDADPFAINKKNIKDINVLFTYKDGFCIYSRGDDLE
ncbi:amidohydrolase [Clostridiaceae bacterium HSG29]|nr:amidohydrolase [Clostridiaceae bacterium HSG29]